MAQVFDRIAVKGQIGRPENVGFFLRKPSEKVIVEEGPLLITQPRIGNSFILNSGKNGILGTWNGTDNGFQCLLGSNGRTELLKYVVNINNLAIERFKTTTFKDTSATTSDWNVTSSGVLAMTNTEVAQSLSVACDGATTWSKATLYSDVTTDVTYYLSADAGAHWEAVTNLTEHVFTVTGTDLRWKAVAGGTVTIHYIKVGYS